MNGARLPFFILIFATIVLEFACNLATGSMPLALQADGVSNSANALAMGAGMFACLFGSLPVGVLVDRIGRLSTIRGAAVLTCVATIGLAYLHGFWWGGVLMGIRGFSLMSYMTAEFAYTAEIVPPERAVSAVSFLGLVANLIFALAPAVGVELWQHGVQREQFLFGTILAVLGLVSLWFLPSRHDVRTVRPSRTIVMRSLWVPTIIFLVSASVYSGVNYSSAVLAFAQRGIGNPALIFTAMAIATAAIRYPAGRLVDRLGPKWMSIPVALSQLIGCVLAARATTALDITIAGAVLGIGWGAIVPVGVGLFFEQSSRRTRGAAMGAYNLALNIGSTAGAAIAALFTHIGLGYGGAMMLCAALPALTLPLIFIPRRKR